MSSPQRLCFQVTEEAAMQRLPQVQQLAQALRELRVRFAIEHFGAGSDPMSLIERAAAEFVKIDGSLMQGLAGNSELQQRVRAIADAAARRESRPSPSASRTPTRWRCCGSSACSTSRATSSTSPKRSCSSRERPCEWRRDHWRAAARGLRPGWPAGRARGAGAQAIRVGTQLAAEQVLSRTLDSAPSSLDPSLITDVPAQHVLDDLFEGLAILSPEGQAMPGAAQSWETSADGLTWIFHLRPDGALVQR